MLPPFVGGRSATRRRRREGAGPGEARGGARVWVLLDFRAHARLPGRAQPGERCRVRAAEGRIEPFHCTAQEDEMRNAKWLGLALAGALAAGCGGSKGGDTAGALDDVPDAQALTLEVTGGAA